jgi:hypothetical protein
VSENASKSELQKVEKELTSLRGRIAGELLGARFL